MRDHSQHIELSRDEAVGAMLGALERCGLANSFSNVVEHVALKDAFGRILAQNVLAKTNIPNTRACCLDSVAVHWDDFENLAEGALPDTSDWVRGRDWQFANTGVAMPEGFDTAIVIEHVRVSDDEQHITIEAAPSDRFAGTREAGSTMHAGDVAVQAGTRITPDVAARIASAGWSSVDALRQPRVAFIPTGDELVPPNLPYSAETPEKYAGQGRVFESNSLVVQGKVQTWGGTFVPFDIVPDQRDAIEAALAHAGRTSDIVVLNAGSSKGSDDWSVEVLEEMGEIICHQTNHGPGHHSSLSIINVDGRSVPVVGISGPSGGASFTLDFYLRPLMCALLGQQPTPERIPCRLRGSFGENKHAKTRTDSDVVKGEARPSEATEPESRFFSVRFVEIAPEQDGILWATPVAGKAGSPATQRANALFMLPAGAYDKFPQEGDVIEVELRFGYAL